MCMQGSGHVDLKLSQRCPRSCDIFSEEIQQGIHHFLFVVSFPQQCMQSCNRSNGDTNRAHRHTCRAAGTCFTCEQCVRIFFRVSNNFVYEPRSGVWGESSCTPKQIKENNLQCRFICNHSTHSLIASLTSHKYQKCAWSHVGMLLAPETSFVTLLWFLFECTFWSYDGQKSRQTIKFHWILESQCFQTGFL